MGGKKKGKGKRKGARTNRRASSSVRAPSKPSVIVRPRKDCWWTFRRLKAWYETKMKSVPVDLFWANREVDYERYTRAFHLGLKIWEHWDSYWNPDKYMRSETVDLRDKYIKEKKMEPLEALSNVLHIIQKQV
jgi:hypothetical protein